MNTLKKDREFQNIYKYNNKCFGFYSLIFFNKNNLNNSRFGFVASKKIGKAHVRNRAKRLFREYVRQNIENLDSYNLDIIIVAKKNLGENIRQIKYKDIEKDFNKIFNFLNNKLNKNPKKG